MGVLMNSFGWKPQDFWSATKHEVYALFDAREEENARVENR
jgi:hypothetical protein